MSSSTGLVPDTSSDEALARAIAESEAAAAASSAEPVAVDTYDSLDRDALLKELRIRDQELVQAVTEVQILRANISRAEELGRNGLIFHPPETILYRQAFTITPPLKLTPVDLYHDADGNLCILGRADFSGEALIHEHRGEGQVKERREKVVGGLVMWPIMEEDVKGKARVNQQLGSSETQPSVLPPPIQNAEPAASPARRRSRPAAAAAPHGPACCPGNLLAAVLAAPAPRDARQPARPGPDPRASAVRAGRGDPREDKGREAEPLPRGLPRPLRPRSHPSHARRSLPPHPSRLRTHLARGPGHAGPSPLRRLLVLRILALPLPFPGSDARAGGSQVPERVCRGEAGLGEGTGAQRAGARSTRGQDDGGAGDRVRHLAQRADRGAQQEALPHVLPQGPRVGHHRDRPALGAGHGRQRRRLAVRRVAAGLAALRVQEERQGLGAQVSQVPPRPCRDPAPPRLSIHGDDLGLPSSNTSILSLNLH